MASESTALHVTQCVFYLNCNRTPYAILDDQRRIIGVLAGRPIVEGAPDEWDGVTERGCAAIEAARGQMKFAKGDIEHRRGPHMARPFGWSHGGGQEVCVYPIPCVSYLDWFICTVSYDAFPE
jgi:hypothetical protein